MTHVLVVGKVDVSGVELLAATPGFTFELTDEPAPGCYVGRLAQADALILRTQQLTADDIAGSVRLQIVSRHGVGYDAVDVAALAARGITLTTVGDVNSQAVAEHTMMLMLALAKRVAAHDSAVRAGNWQYRNDFSASELAGKRLLLIGCGRIGQKVARLAQAFDMHVMALDDAANPEALTKAGIDQVFGLDSALHHADVVSLHCPPDGGQPMLGARQFACFKPGAFLINTARGSLVDETALVDALDSGIIAGAGLDVLADEPPPVNHPLLRSGAVIVTPHIAGTSAQSAQRMSIASVQNVIDFFAGNLDTARVITPHDPC